MLTSKNPAADGAVVFSAPWNAEATGAACEAAAAAQPAWAALSRGQRFTKLMAFREAIAAMQADLVDAIVLETGKLRVEAKQEVAALLGRFDLSKAAIDQDLKEGAVAPGEALRYQPLGVVGVIGPYNFPLHLCHAYAVPALLAGNAVVIKPSDITPLAGQRYAQAAQAANLPPGVLNVVLGGAAVGEALIANPLVHGLYFTGSSHVGLKINAAAAARPELLVALEMGGKNVSIVFDDASLRQAVHEILIGGYLSAGQRCTCTDRVLVQKHIAPKFIDALAHAARLLPFGHPDDAKAFAGPLATFGARDKVVAATDRAVRAGAEAVVKGEVRPGGAYLTASVHRLPDGVHHVAGYTDIEVFGPDLCVETFVDEDEVVQVLNASPYGFANAVFSDDAGRIGRLAARARAGIWNSNRSTNLASPRLPFGGVGKSGNYRPGGAFAHRSAVSAVAMLTQTSGSLVPNAQLVALLPAPDLDALADKHDREERSELARSLVDAPRPSGLRRPAGGHLPTSAAWIERLYAGDRIAKEKKLPVFDHLRSSGPWFVSVDDEPLSILDSMSQTATVCGGFSEDLVVKAFVEGEFRDTVMSTRDTTAPDCHETEAFAETLRQLVSGVPHVTFVASGAEANEKAMLLCKLNCTRPLANRVLAFEGGFHGRTLLSLHATHSPSKRAPFELAGYELGFMPFPVWNHPGVEPAAPSGFYAACASGDAAELERFAADDDALLAQDARSLLATHQQLATGNYFCVIIEPMQSEGGDRYATERFYRALRLLTRFHDTFLVFDEVQVGFGLGGPFAWHSMFRLLTSRGQPDYPDAVTFAKRAQVGVVMSRFDDPEPVPTHGASLVRGRLHAEMMSTGHAAARIEALVRPKLADIAAAFPHLVQYPRATGYALAFDVPTPALLEAFLAQRFWRGAIAFAAGTKTVRYRLSETFYAREIDLLFDAIRRSLAWLDAHPGKKAPEWDDFPAPATAAADNDVELRYRDITGSEAMDLLPAILDIEYQVYEPARRTPPAEIRAALQDAEGSAIICEAKSASGTWQLVGFAIGAPLEHSADVEGPSEDVMLGKQNTMYSASITVAPRYQNAGVGRKLKELQLRAAKSCRRADGTLRYAYVTGRNRVGRTAQMTHLNRVFGAHVVNVLNGQYADPEGQAIYYRIPLGAFAPDRGLAPKATAAPSAEHVAIDIGNGLIDPFAHPTASLVAAERAGALYGPTVNKLTVLNYVTPGIVRAIEWLGAIVPEMQHLYLTSSRDESFDKSLRLLRCTRKKANLAIGLEGGYVGHTIASTRSLSDPSLHHGGPGHFRWPRVPHPQTVGAKAALAALRATIAEHGADDIIGFYYELVQERTGWVLPPEYLEGLAVLAREVGVPMVAVETTTALYRSGQGAFLSPSSGLMPDVMLWWSGGQTGYVHCTPKWFVSTPMALVSTWDGDELSLIRHYHQLRAARTIDVAAGVVALDRALGALEGRYAHHGAGLYRTIAAGADAGKVVEAFARRGLHTRRYPNGTVVIAPKLDEAMAAASRLAGAVAEELR
ncbi:MAG: aldehyde dehydrogenase family protein [Myxococcales bacterium]|nr:aldehyde dehydrogenase family protein [Myxococcales bacterium]